MTLKSKKKPNVLHIITSVNTGGAEMTLIKLIKALRCSINFSVIVLMGRGALSPELEALNIPVRYLNLAQNCVPGAGAIWRLTRFARELRPNIIQGWMYHGNLAACLAKLALMLRPVLIWNIRQTLYGMEHEKRLTRWLIKAGVSLSNMPSQIIYNSNLSASQHEKVGYKKSLRLVIPNGFDLSVFKPSAIERENVRSELNVTSSMRVVGHVARFHPMKDHANMFWAAGKVVAKMDNVCFVFVGKGMCFDNPFICDSVKEHSLQKRVILLGENHEVSRIMTGFDLVVSSSVRGEGFPNVVGEAMATGVPCVVTDVGDSGYVVGETGHIVPPADPDALANAILEMLSTNVKTYEDTALRSRDRIASLFSIDSVFASYLELYLKAVNK